MGDTSYQYLLKLIREQGGKNQTERIYLAEAKSSNTIMHKGLTLSSSDFYFLNEKIEFENGDRIAIYKISNQKFLILGKII